MRNTYLSTSTLVARQLTENTDDMVDEEKDVSFDDLTNTGDYSDYDILEEEKDTIAKKMMSGSKQKNKYGDEDYCQFLTAKKKRIVNIWK